MSGVLTDGGPTSPPLNPDGSLRLESAAPATPGGAYSLWDIPQELTDYLAAYSHGKLWFDIGHKTTEAELVPGVGKPGLIGTSNPELGPYKTQTVKEAHEILRKPEQVMAQYQAMSFNDPAAFMALQKSLASGPWGTVNLNGVFDSYTESALSNAMLMYVKASMGAGVGTSFTDYLLKSAATAQALGGEGTSLGGASGTAPPPVQLTDPAAIRAAAQDAAQAALGRTLSDEQMNQFINHFHASESSYQTTDSGTIVAPDLAARAAAYAQKSNPGEFHQQQRQTFLDVLVNMFAPAGSQRPNETPVAPV